MPRMPAPYQRIWDTSGRFCPVGFRLRHRTQRGVRHWQGGEPQHRGSKCPECKQPLTPIWDLALTDPQLPKFLKELFSPVNRLPFYFCMKCGACSYRVLSPKTIRCLPPSIDGESPMENVPPQLERQRIAFDVIPSQIDALLTLEWSLGVDWLDDDSVRVLEDYVGPRFRIGLDRDFSQFGGQPRLWQGPREIVCPNAKCVASDITHPYPSFHRRLLMKVLAVVSGDADANLKQTYSQIVYHICSRCLTIHAQYECT